MNSEDRGSNPSTTTRTAASHSGRVDKALARTSDAPLRTDNRLELLKDGARTFDDWLAAIERAERWIHLENYIFVADETGQRFSEALCAKASLGVSVRVLYDWFGCLDVPRSHWRKMRDAGVDVRVVNPPTVGTPLGIIRRDHRKLIGVDGLYGSTGGVCISGDWLVSSPETGLTYRDTAVSVRGPAVAEIEKACAGTWRESGSPLPENERIEAGVRIFEYSEPMIHAKTIVADGWWSKIGSTNLNLSSLGANWEIGLVAEDQTFAKKMEDLFEEDIANSREIHLVEPTKSDRQPKIRPNGPIDSTDRKVRRGARRGVVGSGYGCLGHRNQGRQCRTPKKRRPAPDPRTSARRRSKCHPARSGIGGSPLPPPNSVAGVAAGDSGLVLRRYGNPARRPFGAV